MRRTSHERRRHVLFLAGTIAGCALGLLVAAVGGTAEAQAPSVVAPAVLEATHLPPLLTLAGEPVHLTYDVHCAAEGVDVLETACDARGAVLVRAAKDSSFEAVPLEPVSIDGIRRLAATVPPELAASLGGFEYYAELHAVGQDASILVPAGGAEAPHRVLPLESPRVVALGAHRFGVTRPGIRVAAARWGSGPAEAGLEPGRNLPPVGASSFDVGNDGTIVLLDEAHRRALRYEPRGGRPTAVPLSIDGHLADVAVDGDGAIHVLESVSTPGRRPVVRRFDDTGRELDVAETAERPAQIRIGPHGAVALQHPSHQWMPVIEAGAPTTPHAQRTRGRVGRPLRSGGEVVVLRRANEVLAALVTNGQVLRSWRITSGTPLAEVQLAEPVGRRFVLVVRVFTDTADEFVTLVLDRHGLVQQFSTQTDEWAEAAPLGRFRIAGSRLYRLGSNAAGAFVDLYDLKER